MHGRPREYKDKLKADPKAQEAYKKKVDAIRKGTALVLEYRKQRKYDPAILDASAKLLKVVPEIYTLWNYRREALEPVFAAAEAASVGGGGGGSGQEEAQRASDNELALTQACLMENPKSYSTWHHRKWVVSKGLALLERELQLISRALDEDGRNFHAWNYRQFVVRRLRRSAQEELQYVEEKILQNFSNYSAWHFRTILLHQVYCGSGAGLDREGADGVEGAGAEPGSEALAAAAAAATRGSASQRMPIPHNVLDQEYDMVHQAFATDARDESPWMYYRWLVGNTLAHLGPPDSHRPPQTAGQQGAAPAAAAGAAPAAAAGAAAAAATTTTTTTCEERNEQAGRATAAAEAVAGAATPAEAAEAQATATEAEAARAVVAAVLEREASRLLEDHLAAEPDAKWPLLTLARLREAQARLGLGGSVEDCEALLQEARSLYGRLMTLDPMRRGFYEDALEGRAFVVVQALGTV